MFQIDCVSLTSTDSYRCDSYCLARVFQNLPAPPKHFSIFDVFLFRKVFFQLENLGLHLAMSPDDRFLPQSKQIFPKICQVRPMPNVNGLHLGGRPGWCKTYKIFASFESHIYRNHPELLEETIEIDGDIFYASLSYSGSDAGDPDSPRSMDESG